MSVMNDLANEALKPVKTGLFITSAVLVVGGAAIAANSKSGRKFLKNVKLAVTATPPKDGKKQKGEGDIIDVKAEEIQVAQVETKKIETKPVVSSEKKELIGVENV